MENILFYALLSVFVFCFFVQAYFLIVVQAKFSGIKVTPIINQTLTNGVSVIVCARNEAKNLTQNLAFILNQNYPNFEVIVVNDCSFDGSEDLLKGFVNQYPNKLKIVTIDEHPRHKTSKKFAATLGIKASKHEILLFTDADCKPQTPNWISKMVQHYHNSAIEIVLGCSPYQSKPGFLNKIIRYETFLTAVNYFGFALWGMPYMGVGRNLSYKKSLFFKGKGFASHMHIPSGDDDLFVNQHASKTNVALEYSFDAQTISQPKNTIVSYWIQKIRHLGAGKAYKSSHKAILTLQFLSGLFFYTVFIALLLLKIQITGAVTLFFLRYLLQLFIYNKGFVKLQSKDLAFWIIITDPIFYFYTLLLGFFGLFKKIPRWK